VELFEFDDEFQEWQELIDEAERTISKEALLEPISTLSPNRPITVSMGTPLTEVVDLLVEKSIGALLVVGDDRLQGIFSERDLLRIMADRGIELDDVRIDDVMTPQPETLHDGDRILDALTLMHRGGYRHVPIVDDGGRPVGIVSVRDLVAYIVDFFPQEVLNLPPHPIRRGARAREGA
jgi:CBS domain-containing protein